MAKKQAEQSRFQADVERWSAVGAWCRRKGLSIASSEEFAHNMATILRKRRGARKAGYLIEAIQIEAYLLDLFLSLFIVRHGGHPLFDERQRTLGVNIERAGELGFHPPLIERLWTFNNSRRFAMHHLLYGSSRYHDLEDALRADRQLVSDVGHWAIWEVERPADASSELVDHLYIEP